MANSETGYMPVEATLVHYTQDKGQPAIIEKNLYTGEEATFNRAAQEERAIAAQQAEVDARDVAMKKAREALKNAKTDENVPALNRNY
jgi:hypothetical protein